jgi:hypothetical protein
MKLSDAVVLTSSAFKEVYKLYNFKDEDTLKDYCDFVLHEPIEWMRGFPSSWKSASTFSKPRAAFHKLMKESTVVEDLGAEYCENVHSVVWKCFKENMGEILEKRNGGAVQSQGGSSPYACATPIVDDARSVSLTIESLEELHPVPPVPAIKVSPWPKNWTTHTRVDLDYKQKYEVMSRVLATLLRAGGQEDASSENARLRAALNVLLAEFSNV